MMRISFVITSTLILMGGISQLSAQHAGGGHSSSGHGGFSHASSGFSSRSSYSPVASQNASLRTGPYRTGLGYGYAGRRYPALYGYYPYFDPFLDYGSGFYFNGPDQNYGYGQYDPAAENADVTANLLGEQVQRLSAEVDAMRYQGMQENYAPMARPRYNAPPLLPEDETPSSAPVTLVLRDGTSLKLNSYAVMGPQIWDFSAQPAKKIAIASIDLPASRTATEAAGGEFPEIR